MSDLAAQPSSPTEVAEPAITVVIPTYNRRERLDQVLRALAEQELAEPFEVVVVSDGSSDGTEQMLEQSELGLRLRWATQRNQGPAAARNRGVEMAAAPLVLFIDDDVIPCPGLLDSHLDAHRLPASPDVVIGPMLDPPDHHMLPWVRWEQRMLYKQYRAIDAGEFEPTFRQFYTGNASVVRDEVLSAGGFDARYRRAEDLELGMRMWENGARFRFEPEARGLHYAMRSFEAWRDIARAYGRLEVDFARDPRRTWQWEFLSYTYTSRHPAVRALVWCSMRAPRVADFLIRRSERVIRMLERTPLPSTGQWLLSAIYASDYWRAAADALGGRNVLADVVRRGTAPSSPGVAAPTSDVTTSSVSRGDGAARQTNEPRPRSKGTK